MRAHRITLLIAGMAGALTLTGCEDVAPQATVTTTSCGTTIADPYPAFRPEVKDGDVLRVGNTQNHLGFAVESLPQYEVRGDAVRLRVQKSAGTIVCGKVTSTHSWMEVVPVRPGRATVVTPDGETIGLTVLPATS